jgi:3-phytase
MRTFHTQSFTPRNDGARKLAAATRAIMEPVESRLMMSITPVTEQVSAITAKFETVQNQNSGSTAEDPAVWVNATDASLSTVIGTDKQGALTVYGLDGKVIQRITGSGYNSVDVRGNLVAATNLSNNTISFFTVDPATRQLTAANARTIRPNFSGDIYGLAMYQSAESGKTYVFVNNRSGNVEQFEVNAVSGKYDATSVRRFAVGSIAEDMVADDETGALYIAQEDIALWKYGAEPTDGTVRTQVDKVGTGGHLAADIEGLGIYKTANGQGYLIASSQGSSDYAVYDRLTGEYITRFSVSASATVDGAQTSAGLEVTSANLGGDFSGGMFVVSDTKNDTGNENYKLVSWNDIANAQGIPLVIDNVQTPPPVVVTPPPVVEQTFPVISAFNLIDADTGEVLMQLKDGSTVDLSKYAGVKFNIEAVTAPEKGSVKFTFDGFTRVENRAPYRIGGDFGEIALPDFDAGSHSLTATTFNEAGALGEVGNVYTLSFNVITGTTTPPPVTQTPTLTKPSTPTGVSATANGSDSITVKWTAASRATGYKISRSTNGTTYSDVATVGAVTSFTDDNLADSTKYYYKVTAFNAAGSSALSSAVSAYTKAAIDTTPIDDIVQEVTGRPDAKNTGTTGTLQAVDQNTVDWKSNTTYKNLIIKGSVDIRGLSNITFENCVFDAGGSRWGVRADDGAGTNRVFKNCEFKNMASSAIYGGDYAVYNSYVHHSAGDGFKATQNVLIQGCYITMLGMSDGSHADGVQIRDGNNIKIIGNFFDMPIRSDTSTNSSMFLQLDSKNVTFSNNWCIGGNYTVAAYPDSSDNNVKITNNIFYSGTPRFGFGNVSDGVLWSGNVTDSGKTALTNMK